MIYEALDPDDAGRELEWLIEADPHGAWTGFDVPVGEESVWLLHAMYELPGFPQLSVDDFTHRSDYPEGEVGDALAEMTGTNISDGLVGEPGPDWSRLRWVDAMTTTFREQPNPPSFRWLNNVTAAGVQGPPMGSMDINTLVGVSAALAQQSPGQLIFAHFADGSSWSARQIDPCFGDGPVVVKVRPEHLVDLPFASSPSNIWPADRSWIVYTDYDLSGTFVSGPAELIARLEASPDLEVIRWTSPETT